MTAGSMRLVGGDQPAEHPAEHVGVARPELPGAWPRANSLAWSAIASSKLARIAASNGAAHLDRGRGARVAQVQPAEVRVVAEEPTWKSTSAVELRRAGVPRPRRSPACRHELVAPAQEDLPEQVVLVLEERVHRTDRELGQLGDLLQGGLVEALAAEHLLGGVEQLGAAQVLVLVPSLLTPARGRPRWPFGVGANPTDRVSVA